MARERRSSIPQRRRRGRRLPRVRRHRATATRPECKRHHVGGAGLGVAAGATEFGFGREWRSRGLPTGNTSRCRNTSRCEHPTPFSAECSQNCTAWRWRPATRRQHGGNKAAPQPATARPRAGSGCPPQAGRRTPPYRQPGPRRRRPPRWLRCWRRCRRRPRW